mgnify:CR=1 FL=1
MGNGEREDTEGLPSSSDPDDDVGVYLEDICRNGKLLTAAEEKNLAYRMRGGDKAARAELIERNTRLVVSIAKRYKHMVSPAMSLRDIFQDGMIGLIRAADLFDPDLGFRFSTYATWWIRQSVSRALADKAEMIRRPVHVGDDINRMLKATQKLEMSMGGEPTPKEVADLLGWPVSKVFQLRGLPSSPLRLDAFVPVPGRGEGARDDCGQASLMDRELVPLEEMVDQWSSYPEEWADMWDTVKDRMELLGSRERLILNMRMGGFDDNDTILSLGKDCLPAAEFQLLKDGLPWEDSLSLDEIGRLMGVVRERVRQIETKALAKLRGRGVPAPAKEPRTSKERPDVISRYLAKRGAGQRVTLDEMSGALKLPVDEVAGRLTALTQKKDVCVETMVPGVSGGTCVVYYMDKPVVDKARFDNARWSTNGSKEKRGGRTTAD